MTEENIKQRIQAILATRGLNPTNLARLSGVNQKTLNNQINSNTALSVSTILLIIEAIPDISTEWLFKGKGQMFVEKEVDASDKYFEMCKMLLDNRERDAELYLRLADMMKK